MRIRYGMIASAMLWTCILLCVPGSVVAQDPFERPAPPPPPEPPSPPAPPEPPSPPPRPTQGVRPIPVQVERAPVEVLRNRPQLVTRVFDLSHVRAGELEETLALFPAEVQSNDDLRTLTVRAEPDIVSAIEEVIGRLDVAAVERTVELTVYVLSLDADGSGQPVPDHLENVAEQLRDTFGYGGMRLIETIAVRGVDGTNVNVAGVIPPLGNIPDVPTEYRFQGSFDVVERDDATRVLRMEFLAARFETDGYADAQINTSLEIPEGAQVVVGKTSAGEHPLLLVLTAAFPE